MMSRSDRIYRALLGLYPAPFREEFGGPMSQLFRDLRRDAARGGPGALAALWLRTLADLLVTAAREHMERDSVMRTIALVVATLALGLGIAWVDIHNNEIWAGLLLLLSASFLLGFTEPRRAWLWALLIGAEMLLIHFWAAATGFVSPCTPGEVCGPEIPRLVDLLFFVLPLTGAYIGVGIHALAEVSHVDAVWWGGSALAGLAVGLLGARNPAIGNTILVVGLLGILAGFTRPSGVWRWALMLGLLAAITHGWGELTGDLPNLLLKAFISDIVPAFGGAYVGFGLRWLIDRFLPAQGKAAQPEAG